MFSPFKTKSEKEFEFTFVISEFVKCKILCSRLSYYSKMMFLVSDQVYYWGFKSNTHNNYI